MDDLYQHRWISTLWQNNQLTLFENERLTEKIELDIEYFANTNALPTVLEMVLHGMGMGVADTSGAPMAILFSASIPK